MKNQFRSLAMALFVFLSILTGCGGGGGSSVPVTPPVTPASPVASFTSSVTTVVVGGTINFTDTSTKSPTSWTWDFGDGGSSTLQNPSHTFNAVGTWQVKETVTGGSSATMVIVVTASPVVVERPVANISLPITTGVAPFTIVPVNTTTGNATNHLWTYGDGSISNLQNPPVYVFSTPGTFILSLTESNEGGSTTKSITIIVTAPAPVHLTFAPIPESENTEYVNVLLNQAYINQHPELTSGDAARLLIADVNAVLNKNTGNKKRYALNEFMAYPDADFTHTSNKLKDNPPYFKDNYFTNSVGYGGLKNGRYGGTTLVFFVHDGITDYDTLPEPFATVKANAFLGGTWFGNVFFGITYMAMSNTSEYTFVHRNDAPKYANGFSLHDAFISVVVHELAGHGLGVGSPEWYSLNFSDKSGVLPNLGTYNFAAKFPQDPMTLADIVLYNVLEKKFAPLNAWLINKNANHQFDDSVLMGAIENMKVKVKVVDTLGNPVAGATVQSFSGISIGDWSQESKLLETLPTDANGMTQLTNDFMSAWQAKVIKTTQGSRIGGKFINVVDLQEAYWMQEQDEFILTITIQ